MISLESSHNGTIACSADQVISYENKPDTVGQSIIDDSVVEKQNHQIE